MVIHIFPCNRIKLIFIVKVDSYLNKVGANMQLPYKARFGSAKFDRGWGYKCKAVRRSFVPLRGAHKLLVYINNNVPGSKQCKAFLSLRSSLVLPLTPGLLGPSPALLLADTLTSTSSYGPRLGISNCSSRVSVVV